jgi:hypothetical protein
MAAEQQTHNSYMNIGPSLALRFQQAFGHEQEHLDTIRQWHLEATLRDARMVSHG